MLSGTSYDERTDTIIFTHMPSDLFYVYISGEHYARIYGEWKHFLFYRRVKARNKYQAILYLEYYLNLKGIHFHNVAFHCEGITKHSININ